MGLLRRGLVDLPLTLMHFREENWNVRSWNVCLCVHTHVYTCLLSLQVCATPAVTYLKGKNSRL